MMSAFIDVVVGLPPWLVLGLVFLLPALEASAFVGVVVPGEIAVVVGGMVAHVGRLPLWAVIGAASAGAVIGDNVGYRVGRRFGPALLERAPRWLTVSGDLGRALELVRRRGVVAVVAGRWAAALRALVPGLCGMSGLPYRSFMVANVIGGVSWAAAVVMLGFTAGAGYRIVERRLGLGSELLLAVVVLLTAVWVVRARRRRRVAADPNAAGRDERR